MPDVQDINDLRRQILAGEEPSDQALRDSIEALVGERLAAHSAAPKTKTKATPISLDDLL